MSARIVPRAKSLKNPVFMRNSAIPGRKKTKLLRDTPIHSFFNILELQSEQEKRTQKRENIEYQSFGSFAPRMWEHIKRESVISFTES